MMKRSLTIVLVMMMLAGALTMLPGADAEFTQWVNEGTMPVSRMSHAGAELPDGRIFVALGINEDGTGYLNDTWIYDPDAKVWTRMSDSPVRGGFCTATYLGGKVYVFGVYNGGYYDRTLSYDVRNDSWAIGTELPQVKAFMASAEIDERYILLAGGYPSPVSRCYLYDTVDQTYGDTDSLMEGRAAGTLVRDGGKVFYLGGWDFSTTVRDDIFAYDIASRTWDWAGQLPAPRCNMAGVMGGNGLVYLLGGGSTPTMGVGAQSTAWAWDSLTNEFTVISGLPVPIRYATAFDLEDGRVVYMGGYNDMGLNSQVYSLQTTRVVVELTTDTVGQGESAWVRMSFLGEPDSTVNGMAYLVRNDVIWAGVQFSYPADMSVMISFPIVADMPAGTYALEFRDVYVIGETGDHPLPSLLLTVTDTPSAEELAAELEQQILELQAELDAVRAEQLARIQELQTELAAAQDGLDEVNASVASLQGDLDSLLLELALMQEQLDLAQENAEESNESLDRLQDNMTALMISLVQLQGQLDDAQDALDEANEALASSEENVSDTQDQLDGKMDASLGYLILVAVLVGIAVNAVLLMRKKRA